MFLNGKVKLGSKPYCTHHPERVVRKCLIRFKRCPNDLILNIRHTSKRIEKFPESIPVQTYCKCVYSEIPSFLIVLESPALNERFPRTPVIRLFPGTDKLDLIILPPEHRCTEILKNTDFNIFVNSFGALPCNIYSAPKYHNINIFFGMIPFKNAIPHPASYYESLDVFISYNI